MCRKILFFIITLIVNVAYAAPGVGEAQSLVFNEALNSPDWSNMSWGTSAVDFASPFGARSGTRGVSVRFSQPWGGFRLRSPYGFNPSGRPAAAAVNAFVVSFNFATADQELFVVIYGTAGRVLYNRSMLAILGQPALSPNFWHQAVIPLTDVAPDVIYSVSIQNRNPGQVYFDEMGFTWDSTFIAYQSENLGVGWRDFSWQSTRTVEYLDGQFAIKVVPTAPGGDLFLRRKSAPLVVKNGPAMQLRFKIHGGGVVGQDLVARLFKDGGSGVNLKLGEVALNTPAYGPSDNAWKDVAIPLLALNPNLDPIIGIEFQSLNGKSFLVDEIRIEGQPAGHYFPLDGYTPTSVPIASIMDHDRGFDVALNNISRMVIAFNGERGDGAGHVADSTCRAKIAGGIFLSGYNYRGDSNCGGINFLSYDGHGGYDFAVPIGTPVYASDTGIVEAEPDAGNAEGLHCPSSGVACLKEGRMRIRHPYGLSSWSQHLSRQVGGLKVGDRVLKGALIGYSGKTSAANIGPHLHYEVRMDDGSVYGVPFDALGWKGAGVDPYLGLHRSVRHRKGLFECQPTVATTTVPCQW